MLIVRISFHKSIDFDGFLLAAGKPNPVAFHNTSRETCAIKLLRFVLISCGRDFVRSCPIARHYFCRSRRYARVRRS
jgi:hypothetical protein